MFATPRTSWTCGSWAERSDFAATLRCARRCCRWRITTTHVDAFLLIEAIIETPALLYRLNDVVRPANTACEQIVDAAADETADTKSSTTKRTQKENCEKQAINNMETFFIICFATGLVLSLLSVVGGFGDFHFGHFHLPVVPTLDMPHGPAWTRRNGSESLR